MGKKSIVIDLDGVIATGTKETVYSDEAGWAYDRCDLVPHALDGLKRLHEKYHIIVSTARKECDTEKTLQWLENMGLMPYIDEVEVGVKRSAVAYIDDKGYTFQDWDSTVEDFLGDKIWDLTPKR